MARAWLQSAGTYVPGHTPPSRAGCPAGQQISPAKSSVQSRILAPYANCNPPVWAQVDTLDPATHAYSFWEGVPPSGKEAFGRLFHKSSTLQVVVHWMAGWNGAPAFEQSG